MCGVRLGASRTAWAAVLALLIVPAAAGERPDPRLKSVTWIFVVGNNPISSAARESIDSGKSCFKRAAVEADADGVLEVAVDTTPTETPTVGVKARLTLPSGEVAWLLSDRVVITFGQSLGRSLMDRVISRLAADAGCKARKKAGK